MGRVSGKFAMRQLFYALKTLLVFQAHVRVAKPCIKKKVLPRIREAGLTNILKQRLFLCLELFLDLFDIHVFDHRLKVLIFQSLTSYCSLRFILPCFSLVSCDRHTCILLRSAKIGRFSASANKSLKIFAIYLTTREPR